MRYKKQRIVEEVAYRCDFCNTESDFLPCCLMCNKDICNDHRVTVEIDGYSTTKGRIYLICPECIEKYTVKEMNDKYKKYQGNK